MILCPDLLPFIFADFFIPVRGFLLPRRSQLIKLFKSATASGPACGPLSATADGTADHYLTGLAVCYRQWSGVWPAICNRRWYSGPLILLGLPSAGADGFFGPAPSLSQPVYSLAAAVSFFFTRSFFLLKKKASAAFITNYVTGLNKKYKIFR
jgi:hypothetical protein